MGASDCVRGCRNDKLCFDSLQGKVLFFLPRNVQIGTGPN